MNGRPRYDGADPDTVRRRPAVAGPRSAPTRAWRRSAGRAPSSFVPMFVVGGLHLGADLILRIRLQSPAPCPVPGGATATSTGTMRRGCGSCGVSTGAEAGGAGGAHGAGGASRCGAGGPGNHVDVAARWLQGRAGE